MARLRAAGLRRRYTDDPGAEALEIAELDRAIRLNATSRLLPLYHERHGRQGHKGKLDGKVRADGYVDTYDEAMKRVKVEGTSAQSQGDVHGESADGAAPAADDSEGGEAAEAGIKMDPVGRLTSRKQRSSPFPSSESTASRYTIAAKSRQEERFRAWRRVSAFANSRMRSLRKTSHKSAFLLWPVLCTATK